MKKINLFVLTSLFAYILTLASTPARAQCPFTTTITGTDVGCSQCYETGSPYPSTPNCGGVTYHIDTYTVCDYDTGGGTLGDCNMDNHQVGRIWNCVAVANETQVDKCENQDEPALVLVCVVCFTTGAPPACAACAAGAINMDNNCIGCKLVNCAKSADYTPINRLTFTSAGGVCGG